MATITRGKTFISGETVEPADMHQLVDSATVTGIVNADIDASAAIALSKLATGALPAAITVASANLVDGTIVNADINATAAIAGSKLADAGITTAKLADAAVTAAKLDGAQTGSAPIYGCRAWVNFDGTSVNGSNECTLLGSGNVTKVVRNGTGDYTITFATALQDVNYCATGSASSAFGVNEGTDVSVIMDNKAQGGNAAEARTATTLRLTTRYQVTPYNPKSVNVVIFR